MKNVLTMFSWTLILVSQDPSGLKQEAQSYVVGGVHYFSAFLNDSEFGWNCCRQPMFFVPLNRAPWTILVFPRRKLFVAKIIFPPVAKTSRVLFSKPSHFTLNCGGFRFCFVPPLSLFPSPMCSLSVWPVVYFFGHSICPLHISWLLEVQ